MKHRNVHWKLKNRVWEGVREVVRDSLPWEQREYVEVMMGDIVFPQFWRGIRGGIQERILQDAFGPP